MATSTAGRADRGEVSGWAVGFAWFAASMLILIGAFQFFEGLAAVIENEFFVVGPNYVYELDVTAWGWIHMIIGVAVAFAGWGVFSGQAWARTVGIVVALISAISQFFYIPYYPIWAVLIIALCIACIWALAVYGREAASGFSA
jgi:hypothetical protein